MPEEERGYSEQRIIRDFAWKKERNSSRKCSYCDTQGHNRRKCAILKEHVGVVSKQQRLFRKAILDHFHEIGLNIGSLVHESGENATDSRKNRSAIVTDIFWSNVNVMNAELPRFIHATPSGRLGDPHSYNHYTLPGDPSWDTGPQWRHNDSYTAKSYSVAVVGPVDIPIKPPSGWLEDESDVKEWFKNQQSYQFSTDPDSYRSACWWNIEENQQVEKSA